MQSRERDSRIKRNIENIWMHQPCVCEREREREQEGYNDTCQFFGYGDEYGTNLVKRNPRNILLC